VGTAEGLIEADGSQPIGWNGVRVRGRADSRLNCKLERSNETTTAEANRKTASTPAATITVNINFLSMESLGNPEYVAYKKSTFIYSLTTS
jgi:hypothetical protein